MLLGSALEISYLQLNHYLINETMCFVIPSGVCSNVRACFLPLLLRWQSVCSNPASRTRTFGLEIARKRFESGLPISLSWPPHHRFIIVVSLLLILIGILDCCRVVDFCWPAFSLAYFLRWQRYRSSGLMICYMNGDMDFCFQTLVQYQGLWNGRCLAISLTFSTAEHSRYGF